MIIVRAELTQQSNKELFNTEQTLTFGSQPWSCNLWCKVGSSPIEGFHFERRKVPSINNDISFPNRLTTYPPHLVHVVFERPLGDTLASVFAICAPRNVCVRGIGPKVGIGLQNYQKLIKMTWNTIYAYYISMIHFFLYFGTPPQWRRHLWIAPI